jgi:hypothetical protein
MFHAGHAERISPPGPVPSRAGAGSAGASTLAARPFDRPSRDEKGGVPEDAARDGSARGRAAYVW